MPWWPASWWPATWWCGRPGAARLPDPRPEAELDTLARLLGEVEGLTSMQRDAVAARYVGQLRTLHRRCAAINRLFYATRMGMMVGSMALPTLLAVQAPTLTVADGVPVCVPGSVPWFAGVYWFTCLLSFGTAACTAVHTIYRVDRRYTAIHAAYEVLRSEGWQYVHLGGRYSGHHGAAPPTHANQLVFFVHAVEKVGLRLAEDEYLRLGEGGGGGGAGVAAGWGGASGSGSGSVAASVAAVAAAAAVGGGRQHTAVNLQPPSPADPIAVRRRRPGTCRAAVASRSIATTMRRAPRRRGLRSIGSSGSGSGSGRRWRDHGDGGPGRAAPAFTTPSPTDASSTDSGGDAVHVTILDDEGVAPPT